MLIASKCPDKHAHYLGSRNVGLLAGLRSCLNQAMTAAADQQQPNSTTQNEMQSSLTSILVAISVCVFAIALALAHPSDLLHRLLQAAPDNQPTPLCTKVGWGSS